VRTTLLRDWYSHRRRIGRPGRRIPEKPLLANNGKTTAGAVPGCGATARRRHEARGVLMSGDPTVVQPRSRIG